MRNGRTVFAIALVAALGVLVTACSGADSGFKPAAACVVGTDDSTVELHPEQAAHAATITAIGVQRGISDKGIVIALATARQESDLYNIDYGDRDSLGLFQQRPSQGWGDAEQILNPQYATTIFYERLEKIDGWESMRVTEAAQAVQRSAFPEAYEKWAAPSRVIADAFTGNTDKGVACTVENTDVATGTGGDLIELLLADWGENTVLHQAKSSLTIPIDDAKNGWQYASWLVAHAKNHNISRVTHGKLAWEAQSGEWETSGQSEPSNSVVAHFS